MPLPSEWTHDRIAYLKGAWAAGDTATMIAETLGGRFTRNAVLGKLQRLGLLGQRQPDLTPTERAMRKAAYDAQRNARKRAQRGNIPGMMPVKRPAVAVQRSLPVPAPAPPPLNFSIMDLRSGLCRWPVNNGGPYLFCGNAASEVVYCPFHMKMAYDRRQDHEQDRVAGDDFRRPPTYFVPGHETART
jgi:hypothetical protein